MTPSVSLFYFINTYTYTERDIIIIIIVIIVIVAVLLIKIIRYPLVSLGTNKRGCSSSLGISRNFIVLVIRFYSSIIFLILNYYFSWYLIMTC